MLWMSDDSQAAENWLRRGTLVNAAGGRFGSLLEAFLVSERHEVIRVCIERQRGLTRSRDGMECAE